MTLISKYAPQPWAPADRPRNLYLPSGLQAGVGIVDSGRTPINAVGANTPSLLADANGNAFLRFDGVNDQVAAGVAANWAYTLSGAHTVFSVVRLGAGVTAAIACTTDAAAGQKGMYLTVTPQRTTTQSFSAFGVTFADLSFQHSGPDELSVIGGYTLGYITQTVGASGATLPGSAQFIYRNGDRASYKTASVTYPGGNPKLPLTIGTFNGSFFAFDLYCFAIDDRPWSQAKLHQANNYWAALLAGL
jgi:hypothetical protein